MQRAARGRFSDMPRTAAAAGFVNFMGYMGAFAGDYVTGHVRQHYSWTEAMLMRVGWAVAGAIAAGLLWNAIGKRSHETEAAPVVPTGRLAPSEE